VAGLILKTKIEGTLLVADFLQRDIAQVCQHYNSTPFHQPSYDHMHTSSIRFLVDLHVYVSVYVFRSVISDQSLSLSHHVHLCSKAHTHAHKPHVHVYARVRSRAHTFTQNTHNRSNPGWLH
jgi:hypothetical protein